MIIDGYLPLKGLDKSDAISVNGLIYGPPSFQYNWLAKNYRFHTYMLIAA
jgi:hypothetical protein